MWNGCPGSGKTAAFLVPILTQIYTNGPQVNNAAAMKPAVSFQTQLFDDVLKFAVSNKAFSC